jgi:hypothetical protein
MLSAMHVWKARVESGRLKLDEPTDLPEGAEVELTLVDPNEEMTPEEEARLLASLERGIADAQAGRVVSREELHKRLRSLREA